MPEHSATQQVQVMPVGKFLGEGLSNAGSWSLLSGGSHMSSSPKGQFTVGVAIPTMNRPGMLREAIRSALEQERPPDEIFVSDNSAQADWTLIEEFPGAPLRYHWHDRQPMHIEEHWIWALGQPQTDYVCWLEDDNLFRPTHLRRLAEAAVLFPTAPIFGTLALVFRERHSSPQGATFAPIWSCDLLQPRPVAIPRDWALASYLFGSPIASSAIMIDRSNYLSHNFTRCHCSMPLDRWLWAQFAALGDFIYIPEVTVLYRLHGSNHATSIKRATHIRESAIVFDLILEKMKGLGLDPLHAVAELSASLSLAARDQHALATLRSRKWAVIRDFLPPVYRCNLGRSLRYAARVGGTAMLHKLFKL
jgi:hypothetical protein